eukprot:13597636-Alexandrium_andersonii.AAC.1
MQNCSKHPELELRGPRTGLNISTLLGLIRGVRCRLAKLADGRAGSFFSWGSGGAEPPRADAKRPARGILRGEVGK